VTPHHHPCIVTLMHATEHARPAVGASAGGGSWDASQSEGSRGSIKRPGTTSLPHGAAAAQTISSVRARVLHRFKNHPKCACPITAHPLKEAGMLMRARNATLHKGCVPSLHKEVGHVAQHLHLRKHPVRSNWEISDSVLTSSPSQRSIRDGASP
jgi:hypothetical protein